MGSLFCPYFHHLSTFIASLLFLLLSICHSLFHPFAARVTESSGIATDIGFVAYTDVDTSFDTDWVGNVQDDRILVPVHPEPTLRYSSSKRLLFFPSKFGMLCNPFLHALLTYKIYRKILLG